MVFVISISAFYRNWFNIFEILVGEFLLTYNNFHNIEEEPEKNMT